MQKIRSMSDEELAEFLIDLADDGNLRIREWLQMPAEEDDHASFEAVLRKTERRC